MEQFPKPIIYVSKCLGFDHCRYDGQTIESDFVNSLKPYVEFRPVCPEVEIGLGIPRKPIRIVEINGQPRLYQPATGRDCTAEMMAFVEGFLSGITEVDGFLLKSRSPSCGLKDVKIYLGREEGARTLRGSGFFGREALTRFAGLPIEDEGRLRNFAIREHFLTSVFAFARFREMKRQTSASGLMEFHTKYKLLLMGYNQAQMRLLGAIAANRDQRDLQTVLTDYEAHLKLALAKLPHIGAIINVIQHAVGGFKEVLSKDEKQFFLETLEEYRDERIPLSATLKILQAWAIKYKNDYLLNQVFMQPYPKALTEITDSGKGRRM